MEESDKLILYDTIKRISNSNKIGLIPLSDDWDKRKDIKKLVKEMNTMKDLKNVIKHIEDLDVLDTNDYRWKLLKMIYQ